MYEIGKMDILKLSNPTSAILSCLGVDFVPNDIPYIDNKISQVYDTNCYYAGKCVGNVTVQLVEGAISCGVAKASRGISGTIQIPKYNNYNLLSCGSAALIFGSSYAQAYELEISGGLVAGGYAFNLWPQLNVLKANSDKVDWDGLTSGTEGGKNTSANELLEKNNIPQTLTKDEIEAANLYDLRMSAKKDLKMVNDAAKEIGVDRNAFGEYIHEVKSELNMKANQNFSYKELLELAKELKGFLGE